MTYADKPRTDNYVTRTLTCGHEARVDPVVLEQHPGHPFWCKGCADIHPVVQDES